jgi:hypothetical protein
MAKSSFDPLCSLPAGLVRRGAVRLLFKRLTARRQRGALLIQIEGTALLFISQSHANVCIWHKADITTV